VRALGSATARQEWRAPPPSAAPRSAERPSHCRSPGHEPAATTVVAETCSATAARMRCASAAERRCAETAHSVAIAFAIRAGADGPVLWRRSSTPPVPVPACAPPRKGSPDRRCPRECGSGEGVSDAGTRLPRTKQPSVSRTSARAFATLAINSARRAGNDCTWGWTQWTRSDRSRRARRSGRASMLGWDIARDKTVRKRRGRIGETTELHARGDRRDHLHPCSATSPRART